MIVVGRSSSPYAVGSSAESFAEARQTAERKGRQGGPGEEPQAGHCHRAVRGQEERQEGAAETVPQAELRVTRRREHRRQREWTGRRSAVDDGLRGDLARCALADVTWRSRATKLSQRPPRGTKTRSSTSCTSVLSLTAMARDRRFPRADGETRLPSGPWRHGGLASAVLP